ncbi:retrovirus-related pol polyprotein from transposon TNT 1-94 [Tanacetum coccineum]
MATVTARKATAAHAAVVARRGGGRMTRVYGGEDGSERWRGNKVCLKCDLQLNDWIADCGCTKHMTGNRRLFTLYKEYDGGHVVFGSNLKGRVIGRGNITHDSITITNVEHFSGLSFNLISVVKGHRRNGLYTFKLGDNSKQQICLAFVVDNSMLWHRRLGHANMRLVQNLAFKELVRNLPKLSFERHFCDAYGLGSQGNANTRTRKEVSTTRVLELLHLDLVGPSPIQSYRGNLYTLIIVDDHSNYTWVVLVESKKDVLESVCEQHGMSYNLSGPFTSQSNEIVERTHRKLRKMSRAMIDEQSILQKFWCHALDKATYIFNSTWMAFGRNTRDLGSFGEESDKTITLYQIS